MQSFSPSDAAISGFRFIRDRPRVLLFWVGAFVVFELVWGTLLAMLAGSDVGRFDRFRELINTDMMAALAMLPGVAVVLLFGMVGRVGFWAVMFSAAYRAMLFPDDPRLGFIRFGRDEIRMAGVIALWWVLAVGYAFSVAFLFFLLGLMGAALPSVIRFVYLTLLVASCVCAVIWPLVRLSMSMPLTLTSHHFHIFDSWKLTRGLFWPLCGAYAIMLILVVVLAVASAIGLGIITAAVTVATGGSIEGVSGLFNADASTLTTRFSVASVLSVLIQAPIGAAMLAVFVGPFAAAYKAMSPPEPRPLPHA